MSAVNFLILKHFHSYGDRECKECLRSDIDINDDGLCSICEGIINISNDLRDKSFFVLSETGKLKMPFDKFISVIDYEEAERLAQNNNQVRIYSKNKPYIGVGISTNLWMCDYDYASQNKDMREKGIGRRH